MNKTKQILFALVCAFFLFGCNSAVVEKTKSPTETLRVLSEASKKKDTAAIKSYLSKGTLNMLEQSAARQQKSVDELLKQENGAPFQNLPEIKNEQITGETAVVEVKNDVTGEFEKIPFVKEDGVWKVALDVFMKDVMKRLTEEMNPMPANVAGNGEPKKSEPGNSNAKTENK
jgi:hypothetical protein